MFPAHVGIHVDILGHSKTLEFFPRRLLPFNLRYEFFSTSIKKTFWLVLTRDFSFLTSHLPLAE